MGIRQVRTTSSILVVILCFGLAGCRHQLLRSDPFVLASNQLEPDQLEKEFEEGSQAVADPFEGLNRIVFVLNDQIYVGLLDPISKGYCRIVPEPIRRAFGNIYHNATTPARFVSCLLQKRLDEAGVEMGRFVVNSTVGLFGVLDVAGKDLGLIINEDEDMGQALGTFGIEHGPYIVWPILGPSTLRDSIGQIADWLMNPLRYIDPWEFYAGISTAHTINEFSGTFDLYRQVTSTAIEPYIALRTSYVHHRNGRLDR